MPVSALRAFRVMRLAGIGVSTLLLSAVAFGAIRQCGLRTGDGAALLARSTSTSGSGGVKLSWASGQRAPARRSRASNAEDVELDKVGSW